jgi:hypothetical protein
MPICLSRSRISTAPVYVRSTSLDAAEDNAPQHRCTQQLGPSCGEGAAGLWLSGCVHRLLFPKKGSDLVLEFCLCVEAGEEGADAELELVVGGDPGQQGGQVDGMGELARREGGGARRCTCPSRRGVPRWALRPDQGPAAAADARRRLRVLVVHERAGGPKVTAPEVIAATGRSRRRAYELLRDAGTEQG